jgi:2-haloacid dehalogenase
LLTKRQNTGLFCSFSDITKSSLQHALAESNESLDEKSIDRLMAAYDSLSTFPDVPPALEALAEADTIDAYVFSNGTPSMVSTSVHSSPSLSPHASVFKSLITVDPAGVFKPHPKVYQHLATSVGKSTDNEGMGQIWLVSGNPFDVVGAKVAGLRACWVDRAGGHHGAGGWNDRLGSVGGVGVEGPDLVVSGVEEGVRRIREFGKGK